MTIKITESDFLALQGGSEASQRLFERLDAADGRVDGVYHPQQALRRAAARVRRGGLDEYRQLEAESRTLDDALEKAEQKKLRSVGRFRAAAELAADAVERGAEGFAFRVPEKTHAYRKPASLRTFREEVTVPLIELLSSVQAGAIPYQTENPDRTPIRKTRQVRVDLDVLLAEWVAIRDARATPIQRRAQQFRDTNYDEYVRLNDEAMRVMNAAERRLFGAYGFSLSDHSYNVHQSNIRYVTEEYFETPPEFLYDARVPAAETLLRKAEADPAYRKELHALLADSKRLVLLLSVRPHETYTLKGAAVEIHADLRALAVAGGLDCGLFTVERVVKDLTRSVLYQR